MRYPPSAHTRDSMQGLFGFSLMEMLIVISIIGVLSVLVAPATVTLSRANLLTTQGKRIASALDLARQNAMARSTITAFVLNNDPASEGYLRKFSLWELRLPPDGSQPTPGDWKQISRWETLAEGIRASSPSPQFWNTGDSLVVPLPLEQEQSIVFRIFLPSGRLLGTEPGQVRIVQVLPNGTESEDNVFDIAVLQATGRTRITRNRTP